MIDISTVLQRAIATMLPLEIKQTSNLWNEKFYHINNEEYQHIFSSAHHLAVSDKTMRGERICMTMKFSVYAAFRHTVAG